MSRVDFYILQSNDSRILLNFACRLTEKAYRMDHWIYIRTESSLQQKLIDDLLWTFRPGSFIPHNIWSGENDQRAPVLVGCDIDPPFNYKTVLNLSQTLAGEPCQFERIIEIVNQTETIRKCARQRYREYHGRGYAISTHDIQS